MIVAIKKKSIITALALLTVAVVSIIGLIFSGTTQVFFGKSTRLVPVYSVDRGDEKVVALTFDAAWGADKTKGIMDILDKYQAKATFFLVGFWIDKYPEMVKEIANRGFEIGNHSHNHLKMSTLNADTIRSELNYVSNGIEKITGNKCKVFRPPFGDYNNLLIQTTKEVGMQTIQWDVDSLDWKGISSDEIIQRVCSKVKCGSIVLFHNNSDHILEALPNVILNLKNKGYKFVSVSDIIYSENFTIDNNGVQHKAL